MEKSIIYWNPFWNNEDKYFGVRKRADFENVLRLAKRKEAIFLSGVRRCGKTSLLFYLIEIFLKEKIPAQNILYLNLDDELLRHKKLEEIYLKYKELFPSLKGRIYIFLDEIQNIEDWERFVKNKYDSFEDIKFFITGSKSHIIKSESAALLTGRLIEHELYPLDFKEFLEFNGIEFEDKIKLAQNSVSIKSKFSEYLEFGGFPEVVLEKDERIKYLLLKGYFEDIRDKDIIRYFGVKEIKKFENMLFHLISNASNLYSASKLGNIADLSASIVKNYLDYAELAYLFLSLNHFNYSIKSQITNPRKIYSIDTGFINSVSFKFSENLGRLLENIVFLKLIREDYEIYYHKKKYECDFIIKDKNKIINAVQVCKSIESEETKKREIKGLSEAMNLYGLKKGLILTEDEEENFKIKDSEIEVKPIRLWLLS